MQDTSWPAMPSRLESLPSLSGTVLPDTVRQKIACLVPMMVVMPDPIPEAPARKYSLLALLPLLAFAGLAALFLTGLLTPDKARLPSTMIGRSAPDTTLPRLEGLTGNLGGSSSSDIPGFGRDNLTQGQVTLVNVFASWCAPCHAEHPFLMDLAKGNNLRLVGINQKDQPANARRFLAEKGNPYKAVGVDPNGRASIDWGVYGIPETFVLKPDGTITYKLVGPVTQSNRALLLQEIEKAKH
jgi:cytochrome c biogenesis protein CcmG, thiol:disulfide interchange protein DsbE